MDFHSLLRRDLQFLCKRNKIPANMTNVAMADALKSLEIVEGLDEYMNQSNSNASHSPTSVAKQPPNTATRTTRRKTATKAEPEPSSQLVNRSCHLTSKSLAGEMDQEPKTNSVKFEASVARTPAARSTRKASAATSCSSKVQVSKMDEFVQSVYSTRRSTRLLEKCMADLGLRTKGTLDNKTEETEQKNSAAGTEEKSEETEVIPGRNLSASMEKEWEMVKSDSNQVAGNLEVYVDLGDIAVFDANTETNKEKMNENTGDEKEPENSLVQVDEQEEKISKAEEGVKNNDNDLGDLEIYADLGEHAKTETHKDNTESNNVLAFDSSVQVDQQEIDHAIQEKDSEPEKLNKFVNSVQVDEQEEKTPKAEEGVKTIDNDRKIGDLEMYADLGEHAKTETPKDNKESKNVLAFDSSVQVDQQEIDHAIQEKDSEPEKLNNFDEDTNDNGVDSDGTISEGGDSNQAVLGSDIADEEMMMFSELEGSATSPTPTPLSPFAAESIAVQFPRPNKPETPWKNSAMKLINAENNNKENNMEMMNVSHNENDERKGEAKKMKKLTIDEESLKDVSMRQLVKMVKELSIKSSNRTALQTLPGNNQIA